MSFFFSCGIPPLVRFSVRLGWRDLPKAPLSDAPQAARGFEHPTFGLLAERATDYATEPPIFYVSVSINLSLRPSSL